MCAFAPRQKGSLTCAADISTVRVVRALCSHVQRHPTGTFHIQVELASCTIHCACVTHGDSDTDSVATILAGDVEHEDPAEEDEVRSVGGGGRGRMCFLGGSCSGGGI